MPEKKIPPAIWTQIRALYQSGVFNSFDELHLACKKMFKVCPTKQALYSRSKREAWKKNLSQDKIERAIEQGYQELFQKNGLGRGDIVLKIKEGIDHADKIRLDLIKELSPTLSKSKDGKNEADIAISEMAADLLKRYFQSLDVRKGYLDMYFKLTGDYSAVKVKRSRGSSGGEGALDDDMSLDELIAERERMASLLGGKEK